MLKLIRVATFVTAFSASLMAVAGGETMNQIHGEPAGVPLDFLAWLDRDKDWLRESLAKQGVRSGFTISNEILKASTVEALRAVNRIRSFAYLATPGLRPPYFDLSVSGPGGSLVRCVTLFPRSIAPSIRALDFDRESFPASEAVPEILKLCRVQPKKGADYYGLDRNAFRERFFDARGDLNIEFANRNTDSAFIAQAIDHGFFVLQQDYTGRLRLSAE